MLKITVLLHVFLFCFSALAQPSPLPVEKAFALSYRHLEPGLLLLSWKIAPDYFLYQESLTLQASRDINLKTDQLPNGHQRSEALFVGKILLSGTVQWQAHYNPPLLATHLTLSYQGCSVNGFCYPPQSISIPLTSTATAPQDTKVSTLLHQHHAIVAIIGFFLLGLALAFTPCVLPMVPILLGILSGTAAQASKQKAVILTLLYIVSMAFTYALAGLGFAVMGQHLQSLLQTPLVLSLAAVFFFLLGLAEYGYFHLVLPTRLQTYLQHKTFSLGNAGPWAAIAMGILSTLILSPCVTPPLVGALSYITQTGNLWLGSTTLFALGLGMGLPLLLASFLGYTCLPKTGAWMKGVNEFLALLLFAIAIWLLARYLPRSVSLLLWGSLGGFIAYRALVCIRARILKTLLFLIFSSLSLFVWTKAFIGYFQATTQQVSTVNNSQQLALLLAKAQKEHRAVILDFYADWCVSCQYFEQVTRQDPKIQELLRSWQLIRVDITKNTPQTQILLQQYGVIAPPTFVFLDEQGHELDHRRWTGQADVSTFSSK